MNASHPKPDTEAVVERLDLAIERAELVHALGRLDDRIHALRQGNAFSADIKLLERTARSLRRRLETVKRKCDLK